MANSETPRYTSLLGRKYGDLRRRLGLFQLVLALQAVAEGANALGGVAHDRRQPAAAAEHQGRDHRQNQPMPNAESSHHAGTPRNLSAAAREAPRDAHMSERI